MSSVSDNHTFVGPHEGRELELLLNGKKPLAMFVEPIQPDFECFPEAEFDKFAAHAKLKKHVALEEQSSPFGEMQIRRVLYAVPGEEWRIPAMLLVQSIYRSLSGWRPDLERIIGGLLGYEHDDIEKFATLHEPPTQ